MRVPLTKKSGCCATMIARILRSARRSRDDDGRPHRTEVRRRQVDVGEPRCSMRGLQQAQARPHAGASRNAASPQSARAGVHSLYRRSAQRVAGATGAVSLPSTRRADELGEFLVVYAKVNGVEPNAVKHKLSVPSKARSRRRILALQRREHSQRDRLRQVDARRRFQRARL